ncbi:hypothetical protein [Flavobacterium bizetiae]|nr:hypothetical protein [Flavobacterium bizetiae]CAD5343006.1 hypothetical protein FLA105535_03004 [Flavobacterium bizetiae]CAD5350463.1 hypothetical protein FLA105534_04453 [Flavobacterium bizetiae]
MVQFSNKTYVVTKILTKKMDKCKLCKTNVADKMNSHIIPKFMCQRLFEDAIPRHSIEINSKGKSKKIQDSPKENNIFCTSCEKRMGILETYFSKKIIDIHNFSNVKDRIDLETISNQKHLVCKNIKPTMFKLFIYSLVWRSSISKLNEFEKYHIDDKVEEELRVFLNDNLKTTHKELLENIENNIKYPSYHFCLIKPIARNKQSRGIFTAFNSGEKAHLLMLIDFAVFFYTDEKSIGSTLKYYSNKQNEKVIIATGDIEKWTELNRMIVQKMLNKKNSM